MSEKEPEHDGQEPDEQPEDDDIAEAFFPGSGPNREEMLSNYLPENDEWEAKTILDLNDPAAVAALDNLGMMYPEVDDLQPIVDEFLEEFLKSRISVQGKSRSEFRDMFISAFGGKVNTGDENSRAFKLVAAEDE